MTTWDDLWTQADPVAAGVAPTVPMDGDRGRRYAATALQREAIAVAEAVQGARNHTLNKAAYSLGQIVAAGLIGGDEVNDTLWAAARAAGLDDAEIAATLKSGARAGQAKPRVVADPSTPETPAVVELRPPTIGSVDVRPSGAQEQSDTGLPTTWGAVDLGPHLDGTYRPELPSLMPRADLKYLLYPGRVHSFHGESESGKSLVAQIECARLLGLGRDALYIDFESDAAPVVNRMRELGATVDQVRAHFTYVRPDTDPRKFPHEREALTTVLSRPYDVAVIDGVTDALGVFGARSNDNDEVAAFQRLLPRAICRLTGAAVVMIDHTVKDADQRGRFAIGAQAKMAGLDGAAYTIEVVTPIGRGMRGELSMRIGKDRNGGVRPNCGAYRKLDRTQEAARITVDSTRNPGRIECEVLPPSMTRGMDEWRPSQLMEKLSMFLEVAERPLSQKTLLEGVGGKRDTAKQGLALLIRDGHVATEAGIRGAVMHTSTAPYRAAADPKSDSHVATIEATAEAIGDGREHLDLDLDPTSTPPRPGSRSLTSTLDPLPVGGGLGQVSENVDVKPATSTPDNTLDLNDPDVKLVACPTCSSPIPANTRTGQVAPCAKCGQP